MWFLTKLWFKISFYKSPISCKYGDKTISGASAQLQESTISLKIKGPSSKSCGFSSSHVWMWELDYKESWVQKNDAFELWCWRRLLRVPWTARRSNQSILKEISPGCSLEGLMYKVKLQYFATWCENLTHLKIPWCWERLRAGGEGYNRGWDGWMALPTQWTWVWVNSGSWWWTVRPGVLWFMGSQIVGHNWETELNWTESPTITEKWHYYRGVSGIYGFIYYVIFP